MMSTGGTGRIAALAASDVLHVVSHPCVQDATFWLATVCSISLMEAWVKVREAADSLLEIDGWLGCGMLLRSPHQFVHAALLLPFLPTQLT